MLRAIRLMALLCARQLVYAERYMRDTRGERAQTFLERRNSARRVLYERTRNAMMIRR